MASSCSVCDFGYDTDSCKAEKVYRRVALQAGQLFDVLGQSNFEYLINDVLPAEYEAENRTFRSFLPAASASFRLPVPSSILVPRPTGRSSGKASLPSLRRRLRCTGWTRRNGTIGRDDALKYRAARSLR